MEMRLVIDGREIVITTNHATSSYGQPVVLVDSELTNIPVSYEPDESDDPTILDLLADAANIHDGHRTRRALSNLAIDMLPDNPTGADYDLVIAEFKSRGKE